MRFKKSGLTIRTWCGKHRGILLLVAIALLSSTWPAIDWWVALPEGLTARYTGRKSCVDCHSSQSQEWEESDHDLAMDEATPEFVLGDFDNTSLEHHGVTSRMSRRGDEFFVETEGPDGGTNEFRVKYVLGYQPLQQYLAELDRGHIQVFPVSWDTEGKRWFFANPDAPFGPNDPLHWTGSAQNFSHMCADCHTTNFDKGYDVAADTYHSTWSEIDVSCESCHGPGSIHVELANSGSIFWDRRYGYGLAELKGKSSTPQLETCAPCHSRRRRVSPGFQPGNRYSDHYGLSLLDDNLYHADGQIKDEVYVHGSFTQSLMYRKGVRCTNCHDPHTTRIRFEGNRLCTQCHVDAKYDATSHHHHQPDSAGSKCVECHMPEKTYMVVDPRRDHSLRMPRPDLTVSIGTPNACNQCHQKPGETPQWAADKVVEWYGSKRRDDPHYGEIIDAGRRAEPAAHEQLVRLSKSSQVGPIVRATAVSLLATRYPNATNDKAILRALKNHETPLRAAALQAFDQLQITSNLEARRVHELLMPRLTDRSTLVRTEAARVASAMPINVFSSSEKKVLQQVIKEYHTGLMMNSDQSGAHMSLGILETNLGNIDSAVDAYRTAIRLDPAVAGPRSNLTQLLAQSGKKDEVRKLRTEEAGLLRRDAKLLPDNALLRYRLGLLEYLLDREAEAEDAMAAAVRLEPRSTEFLMALTLLYEKQKRWDEARRSARKLTRMDPDNAMFQQMLLNYERAAASSAAPPAGPMPVRPSSPPIGPSPR